MLDALHQVVADQVARVGLVLQARRLQRAAGVPWSWWNELSVQEQRDVTRVVEALEELGAAAPTFLRLLATRDVIPALTWVALTLVALLGELPHGVGDEFGWVAVDAPGGQLLGERERVEQGVNPYGRPESRTTMRWRLRETTSVMVAVQQPPRLSVMLIGVPRGSSGSAATPGPSSAAPQPSSSL